MTAQKRQGAVCRKSFDKSASCHISVYRSYFQGGISAKRFFSTFLFRYFPFLGSGCKSRIVFRRRSRSYSGGDKSLTPIPDTSDLSDKDVGKVHACPSQQVRRQTSYLSLFRLCLLRWLLYARFITLLSYLIVLYAIRFLIFIRICLFPVYLHFDAVFTVSHPLAVPVQAQR